MAVERWEAPKTVTALRGFLGFANYYSMYIENFAGLAAPLTELLKVDKEAGRKGSKVPVQLGAEQLQAFADVKKALLRGLKLQVVNPDRPYVLRVDASGKGVGAVLKQHPSAVGRPTPENSKPGMTVPVAFMSRKLTDSQQRVWDVREKEAYAILLALEKWSSWIGLQPVLILSDHETLKSWAREHLQVPAGPTGRRARWHQRLSRYDITVAWIPGKENVAADALSRWAYPASREGDDVSWHGTAKDREEMKAIIAAEKEEEKTCIATTGAVPTEALLVGWSPAGPPRQ
jgi:hypothetical protein